MLFFVFVKKKCNFSISNRPKQPDRLNNITSPAENIQHSRKKREANERSLHQFCTKSIASFVVYVIFTLHTSLARRRMFVVRSRHQPRQQAAHVDGFKIHDVKKLCSSSKHLCLKLNNQRKRRTQHEAEALA